MHRFSWRIIGILVLGSIGLSPAAWGKHDGLIHNGEQVLFPIGFYEHPKEVESLRRMAEAGVNLVHCNSQEDLDRAASVGLMGVVPLPLQNGATDQLRKTVSELRRHPALAAWEGPDEIVWNFTAASMLHRTKGIHRESGEWWRQTENAMQYSQEQADQIIPAMREAVDMIRKLDQDNHPVWMNEALQSDVFYVRKYLDFVDIVGCDIYPVKKEDRRIHRMASATDRWIQVGRGKPVWMVLQTFAWSELGEYYGVNETAYPTFQESRFMAYDVIAHGAKGVLYWGSAYLKSEKFRESIYALTRELAQLQPFLTAEPEKNVVVRLIEIPEEGEITRGVKVQVRRCGGDWLIILVNEDDQFHMGVEVGGLGELNGRQMELLYGEEQMLIQHGEMVTRMRPYEVKAFATGREWEAQNLQGRGFISDSSD